VGARLAESASRKTKSTPTEGRCSAGRGSNHSRMGARMDKATIDCMVNLEGKHVSAMRPMTDGWQEGGGMRHECYGVPLSDDPGI